jgi:hypothetical protein
MSYVIAVPEMMTSAASDLAAIGSDVSAAHLAAATPTVSLIPAAADEVSAAVTHLFSRYAQDFHGLAAKAAAFHDQFMATLTTGAHSYAATEAAAVASLGHGAASLPSLPSIGNILGNILVPLHQWFLTWPASIQGFVNDITRPLQAALVPLAVLAFFGVILAIVALLPLAAIAFAVGNFLGNPLGQL